MNKIDITILIPCYNEEETITKCINNAFSFLRENKFNGEVLVVDNNSTDNSYKLAKKAKARVIKEKVSQRYWYIK